MRRCCSGRHDDLEPALLESLVQSTQPGGVLTRNAAERLSTIIDTRARVCFTLLQVHEQKIIFRNFGHSAGTATTLHHVPMLCPNYRNRYSFLTRVLFFIKF
jgi:hypothetical protein